MTKWHARRTCRHTAKHMNLVGVPSLVGGPGPLGPLKSGAEYTKTFIMFRKVNTLTI